MPLIHSFSSILSPPSLRYSIQSNRCAWWTHEVFSNESVWARRWWLTDFVMTLYPGISKYPPFGDLFRTPSTSNKHRTLKQNQPPSHKDQSCLSNWLSPRLALKLFITCEILQDMMNDNPGRNWFMFLSQSSVPCFSFVVLLIHNNLHRDLFGISSPTSWPLSQAVWVEGGICAVFSDFQRTSCSRWIDLLWCPKRNNLSQRTIEVVL